MYLYVYHLSYRSNLVKNVKKITKNSEKRVVFSTPSPLHHSSGSKLVGPMPVTARGNKYIITLTDYFTKWAEAAPLPDKTALGVAKFMYSVSFSE